MYAGADMIPIVPMQIKLAVLAAAIVGAGISGWTVRGWKEDAARLDVEREAIARMQRVAAIYGQALTTANGESAQQRQQAASDQQEFTRRLRDAKRQGSKLVGCGAGLERSGQGSDLGAVRFDPAFVRLWNDGLAIGLPEAYRAGRPDRSGAGADFLEPEDFLENVAENGGQCNEVRGRLLVIQRWWAGIEP